MPAQPTTPKDVQAQVQQALADNAPLHLTAGQSKFHLGRRVTNTNSLDLSALNQLVSYEPGELILVVRPGMRLDAIEELLAAQNQHLAFEPPHWGDAATAGGTVACNLIRPFSSSAATKVAGNTYP